MGVTIKDVAKAAGTSVSTVSKVINGHYSISGETARRVRAGGEGGESYESSCCLRRISRGMQGVPTKRA